MRSHPNIKKHHNSLLGRASNGRIVVKSSLVIFLCCVFVIAYVRMFTTMHQEANKRNGVINDSEDNASRNPGPSPTSKDNEEEVVVDKYHIGRPKRSSSDAVSPKKKNDHDKRGAIKTLEGSLDVHLFVLWKGSIEKREKILMDIATKFIIADVKYFDWTSDESLLFADSERAAMHWETLNAAELKKAAAAKLHYNENNVTAMQADYFLMNLWRLYGGKGGAAMTGMALKVKQCGRGPFIAVVVMDPNPDYRDEVTFHGTDRVNHNMNDAKKLYRRWSGGGFRVHGTFNPEEAAHDIGLLLHKLPHTYLGEFLRHHRHLEANSSEGMDVVAKARESGRSMVQKFLASEFPPSKSVWLGPRSTFEYRRVEAPWRSCKALLQAVTFPWVEPEREAMEREAFKALGTNESLSVPLCESWPIEVAVTAPRNSRWAVAAILNGRFAESNDQITIEVPVKRKDEVVLHRFTVV